MIYARLIAHEELSNTVNDDIMRERTGHYIKTLLDDDQLPTVMDCAMVLGQALLFFLRDTCQTNRKELLRRMAHVARHHMPADPCGCPMDHD